MRRNDSFIHTCNYAYVLHIKFTHVIILGRNLEILLLSYPGRDRSVAAAKVSNTYQFKSYCSTVHFRRITSIYRPMNAHIISHKTLLKHFKTLPHVSMLSVHHQGALFLAKVILRYSQFNSYLQTRCCGSISCCVGMCCGASSG